MISNGSGSQPPVAPSGGKQIIKISSRLQIATNKEHHQPPPPQLKPQSNTGDIIRSYMIKPKKTALVRAGSQQSNKPPQQSQAADMFERT